MDFSILLLESFIMSFFYVSRAQRVPRARSGAVAEVSTDSCGRGSEDALVLNPRKLFSVCVVGALDQLALNARFSSLPTGFTRIFSFPLLQTTFPSF